MRYIKPQTKWREAESMIIATSSAEFDLDELETEDDVVAGSRTDGLGHRRNIWDEGW